MIRSDKIWKILQLNRAATVAMIACLGKKNKSHLKYRRLSSSSTSTTKVPGEEALDSLLLRCSCSLANGTWLLQRSSKCACLYPSFSSALLSECGWALCQINTTENMTPTLDSEQRHVRLWHWWSPWSGICRASGYKGTWFFSSICSVCAAWAPKWLQTTAVITLATKIQTGMTSALWWHGCQPCTAHFCPSTQLD